VGRFKRTTYDLHLTTTGDWCSGSARQPLKLKVAARHRDPLFAAVECDWRARLALNELDAGRIPAPLLGDKPRAIGEVVSHLAYTQRSKVRFLDCPLAALVYWLCTLPCHGSSIGSKPIRGACSGEHGAWSWEYWGSSRAPPSSPYAHVDQSAGVVTLRT
jgi:hypothetical protein